MVISLLNLPWSSRFSLCWLCFLLYWPGLTEGTLMVLCDNEWDEVPMRSFKILTHTFTVFSPSFQSFTSYTEVIILTYLSSMVLRTHRSCFRDLSSRVPKNMKINWITGHSVLSCSAIDFKMPWLIMVVRSSKLSLCLSLLCMDLINPFLFLVNSEIVVIVDLSEIREILTVYPRTENVCRPHNYLRLVVLLEVLCELSFISYYLTSSAF